MDLVKLLNSRDELSKAVKTSSADPAFIRALHYMYGLNGVVKDEEVAKVLLSKNEELPEVQYVLGIMAEENDDERQAERHYWRASELGAERFVRPSLESLYESMDGLGKKYLSLLEEFKQLKTTLVHLAK